MSDWHIGRITKTYIENTVGLEYNYNKGLLESVKRSDNRGATPVSQTYSMDYDPFGNMTKIQVGNKTLASYAYENYRLLKKQTYGNGQAIEFTYDDYDRLVLAKYPDGREVAYTYTGDGNVFSIEETGGDSPRAYTYDYDSLGRLLAMWQQPYLGHLGIRDLFYTQGYDANDRIASQYWQFGDGKAYTTGYTYNPDGTLKDYNSRYYQAEHSYDSLLRLEKVEATPAVATREYDYRDLDDSGKTTTQVEKLTYPNLDSGYHFQYGYDSMGNITSYTVTCDGHSGYSKPAFAYTYDNQNQLLSATSGNRSYSYTYDGAGNLLTANKNGTTHTYTYGNADWKDMLTAYDGQTISYDNAGNPTSYYNGTRWTFTWGNGRRLETATNGSTNISYNYTADGIRTSKTINGLTHTYYYSGSTLLRETYDDNILDFFYDASGTPVAFKYNDNVYYYITNLQGDVIRLVDSHGNTAACYEYDPYGNALDASGSHATINPLRYRGYYYDNETGLYYLQSRYYDPVVGRFINSDSYASTGQGILGNNMFAYCNNNPVNWIDSEGCRCVAYTGDLGGALPKKPNIFEEVLEAVTDEPSNPVTVSAGIAGNATYYGLGFGESFSLSVDSTHTYAIQHTISKIVSTGTDYSGSVGLNITITDAKYVEDLDGDSLSGGFTIIATHGMSVDYVTFVPASDPNTRNHGISFTIAVGVGAGKQSAQNTTTTLGTWNPFKELKETFFGS